MSYDQLTKDLCRKASADVREIVDRVASLLDAPEDRMMLAIWAAGGALGSAAGFITALVERDTGDRPNSEEAVDALWEMVRPVVLKTAGGDDAPFRALLERCAPTPPGAAS